VSAALFFLACAGAYVGAFITRARHRLPVLLLASAIVGVLLLLLGAPYEEAFKRGIAPYSYLLGPMTVALAVPLADSESGERGKLGLLSVVLAISTIASVVGIVALVRLLGGSDVACASLAPRGASCALSVPS
jgi:putative effector of murein hydrolase